MVGTIIQMLVPAKIDRRIACDCTPQRGESRIERWLERIIGIRVANDELVRSRAGQKC